MRAHYFAQARWFCALALLSVITSLSKDLILNGALPNRNNVIFHAVFCAIALVAAFTTREWFHKIFALAMAVLFGLYVVLLFGHLQ